MEKQVVSFPTSCADRKGLDPSEKFQVRIQFFRLKMNSKPCSLPLYSSIVFSHRHGGVSTTGFFPICFSMEEAENSGGVISGAQGSTGIDISCWA